MGLVTSGQSEIEALLTQALGWPAGKETQSSVQSAGFYEGGSLPAFLLLLTAHPILAVPGSQPFPWVGGAPVPPWRSQGALDNIAVQTASVMRMLPTQEA